METTKTFNQDSRSKTRLRFASSRKRAKSASADIYRNYKRRYGVTTAAVREEQVHSKRKDDEKDTEDSTSTLAEELDIAMDRNASDVFGRFYREIWHLVRSLPEVLHHAEAIIDILNKYLLSPDEDVEEHRSFSINHATTDILHLYAVFARDMRHEIHKFLHTKILPRFLDDLLCPSKDQQQRPMDVTVVEAVFRTLSYIFRYDCESIVSDGDEPCLEQMRQYYGRTLAHRRELVRRLSAEAFAPLIRKLKSDSARKRHLKRVLKAIAAANKPRTEAAKRLQEDAIDGISQLLFQVCRGASGKLHSKGSVVIKCALDCVGGTMVKGNLDLLKDVVSAFLDKLLAHLKGEEARQLVLAVVRVAKALCTEDLKEHNKLPALLHVTELLSELVQARMKKGDVSREERPLMDQLISLLDLFLVNHFFAALPLINQKAVIRLLCDVWKMAPEIFYNDGIGKQLCEVLVDSCSSGTHPSEDSPLGAIVRDLISELPRDVAMRQVGSLVLCAATRVSKFNRKMSLAMVHSLLTTRCKIDEEMYQDDDRYLFFENAQFCYLSSDDKEQLLNVFMNVKIQENVSEEDEVEAAIAAQTSSFVCLVPKSATDKSEIVASYNIVADWLTLTIEKNSQRTVGSQLRNRILNLTVEAFGCLSYQACCLLGKSTIVKAALDRINQIIFECLKCHSSSLLTLKAVSSIVRAGKECGHSFSSDTEMLFDLLIPNLHHESHFMRQHSLEILSSLPKKPFVVNHSDLDLSGDLDEEPSASSTGPASSNGPVGICHVIDTLLEIETTTLCLQNERHICSLASRVEVIARSGKLPVVYAEAASSHMLGVLNCKFSPLWSACIKALVALLKVHSKYSWPFLWNVLSCRIRVFPRADGQQKPRVVGHDSVTTNPHAFVELCSRWDESLGRDFQLFAAIAKTASDAGSVSRHSRTDNLTVLQSLWSVFEEYPDLWIQHSREMVPLVIEFLHLQYFAISPRDPDARELKLFDHVPARNVLDSTSSIDRHAVVNHLKLILKALALVRGPQQLAKHELLYSIHSKLVGHPDYAIADLALSCILRYKPAALTPYDEHLRKLLSKGKLREGLLELRSADEDGNIATEHRADLLACVSRILFGRLSAKATSGSSKDSPGARRNAIVSFLSSMCRTFAERSVFVNLMIRPYVSEWETNPVSGLREEKDLLALQNQVEMSSLSAFEYLPLPVHQGFLNTLGAVITHFGQSARPFTSLFITLVLKVCSLYEIGEINIDQHVELDGESDPANWNEEEFEVRPIEKTGQIRALCYRRLGDIFNAYNESIDVSCFSENIWRTLDKALRILPRMGVIADKAPALLGLLRTISLQSNMVVLFEHHNYAVPAVIDCIDAASSASTVDHCLSFIENLLCDDERGVALVEKHAIRLLTRFQSRLNDSSVENRKAYWFRELKVLCRVSELIKFDSGHDKLTEIGQRICVLLTPYLSNGSRCSNDAKENIVSILKRFSEVLSEETAERHYQELAKVFGPSKGGVGTMSKSLRSNMAHLIVSLTNRSCRAAKPAAEVLVNLNKLNEKRVDETDAETVILTLSALSDVENPVSWKNLCRTEDGSAPFLILPVVNCCFFHLYCEDGVVARTSFRALKILVEVSIDMVKSSGCEKFQKLIEGCIVPHCRVGIASQNAAVRKYFILLIKELAGLAAGLSSANLHGDLIQLIRDDEPDLDFFLAVTHVQLHRRAKAFQRLRKDLVNDDGACRFTARSLSHILLPIAMHPAYEATSKVDSALALEGAATVGALARHLSWSKYNEVLWTTLNQFQRHPSQETYLIGVICSLLDAFHFSTAAKDSNDNSESQNAVQRALNNRILPKLEELLTKDVVDGKGNKSKTLRPSIVLAMVKLFKKLSCETLESRLPRLLTVVCDALKGRDIKVRDLGRETLAKVAAEIGMEYLADITRELALTLKDGYRLHVRAAALHSVILKLSSVYVPTENFVGQDRPHFDSSVIALMDLIQQDLFGVAQERKDADNAVSYVQEAVGSKSYHSIELIASMITFDPTLSSSEEVSSIHALVTPFLEKLRLRSASNSDVKRAKECLSRVVIGLNRNPTVVPKAVLPFVYSTLRPFLEGRCADDVAKDNAIDFDESAENDASLKGGMVVEWNPTSIGIAKSAGEAKEAKASRLRENQHVQDGYSAPKLTGSDRHVNHLQSTTFDDHKSNTYAVGFGLRMLHSTLKKRKSFAISGDMLDPFVGWLSYCYCRSRDSDIVLLSLKCLGLLLEVDLPSLQNCSQALATKTLDLLTTAGPSSSVDPDLLQSSFKMLTYLLTHKKNFSLCKSSSLVSEREPGERANLSHNPDLPLNSSQMEVLILFLKASLADSEQHTPAMGLAKTILSRRYITPEIYDLAETLLELTVRSSKVSLREQSASAVVSFLINYPLSDERVEQHLQQILLNLQYEYSDGRLSGCRLLLLVIEAFPSAVIERHVESIFLPLALQFGNEENKECRQLLKKCISSLLQRLSPEIVQKLFTYAQRWSQSSGQLQLLAAKLYIIFMEYQDGFLLKKDDQANRFMLHMHDIVSSTNDWQPRYFAILAIEKLFAAVPNTAAKATAVWRTLVKNLGTEKNAWIKIASSRIIYGHLQTLSPTSFADSGVTSFLLEWPGALFQLVRNLCFHLGSPEEEQNDELVTCTVNCLTWCLQAMDSFPGISYSDKVMALSDGDFSTDEKEDDKNSPPKRHPATWLLTRLSNIAKLPGTKRRQAVYKCFGSFASADTVFTSNPYLLELVLTPLNRSMMESRHSELPVGSFTTSTASNGPRPDAQLAQEVWELFEEKIPSATFVSVMNTVQSKASEKAAKRKETTKAEYVLDPAKSAERRIKKHEREKERRKRKVDDRRRADGRSAKRRHGIDEC